VTSAAAAAVVALLPSVSVVSVPSAAVVFAEAMAMDYNPGTRRCHRACKKLYELLLLINNFIKFKNINKKFLILKLK
jgi:hypothetical protein